MSTPNPHEERAREAKAQRLAHRAVEALIRTAADTTADGGFWPKLLQDDSASEETRKRVVVILRMLRPVKLEGWNL